VCCSVLPCVAVCHVVHKVSACFLKQPRHIMQHIASHCNTLHHTATHCKTMTLCTTFLRAYSKSHIESCNTLQHTAIHCNTLQRTATHCNVLQHTATYCNVLQRTAPHCTTLHHAATHCNTLQHDDVAPAVLACVMKGSCHIMHESCHIHVTHQRVTSHYALVMSHINDSCQRPRRMSNISYE